jgi:hypothetical protein
MAKKLDYREPDTRFTIRLPLAFGPVLERWASEGWITSASIARDFIIQGVNRRLEAEGKPPLIDTEGERTRARLELKMSVRRSAPARAEARERDRAPAPAAA